MTQPLLQAEDVNKHLGGVHAVVDLCLSVGEREVVAIIGPNGAGKTTFLRCVGGVARPESGSIRLAGVEIQMRRPSQIARMGVARTFQEGRPLTGLSVLDNVLLAGQRQPGESLLSCFLLPGRVASAERRLRAQARELLREVELDRLADEYAGNLSGGQQKLLDLARALMTHPRLLLLDEPVAGVNPRLADRLVQVIRQLTHQRGVTVLFTEHNMDTVVDLADRVIVMDRGSKLCEGPPEVVLNDSRVIEAYLGAVVSEV